MNSIEFALVTKPFWVWLSEKQTNKKEITLIYSTDLPSSCSCIPSRVNVLRVSTWELVKSMAVAIFISGAVCKCCACCWIFVFKRTSMNLKQRELGAVLRTWGNLSLTSLFQRPVWEDWIKIHHILSGILHCMFGLSQPASQTPSSHIVDSHISVASLVNPPKLQKTLFLSPIYSFGLEKFWDIHLWDFCHCYKRIVEFNGSLFFHLKALKSASINSGASGGYCVFITHFFFVKILGAWCIKPVKIHIWNWYVHTGGFLLYISVHQSRAREMKFKTK